MQRLIPIEKVCEILIYTGFFSRSQTRQLIMNLKDFAADILKFVAFVLFGRYSTHMSKYKSWNAKINSYIGDLGIDFVFIIANRVRTDITSTNPILCIDLFLFFGFVM